jgi:Ca2+-transporting ATPase
MSFKKGVPFYKTEVFTNRFVWLAIGCCLALSAIPYFIPMLKRVLDLNLLFAYDWLIIVGFSSCVVLAIQILKRLRIVI